MGDDIPVAPVTRQASRKDVWLPAGTWYDYWTHEAYHGPAGVTVAAPLDRLPLFVRGGAIIPQGPVMQYDGERSLDEVTLLVYPEGVSSFSLYEDDGLTNAYRDGCYAETCFTCTTDAAGLTFHINPTQGLGSLLPANRRYLLKLRTSRAPHEVRLEGADVLLPQQQGAESGWWHDGANFLFVDMPQTPCTARITW